MTRRPRSSRSDLRRLMICIPHPTPITSAINSIALLCTLRNGDRQARVVVRPDIDKAEPGASPIAGKLSTLTKKIPERDKHMLHTSPRRLRRTLASHRTALASQFLARTHNDRTSPRPAHRTPTHTPNRLTTTHAAPALLPTKPRADNPGRRSARV